MNLTLSRFMRAMLRPYSFSVGVMLVVAVIFAVQTSLLPYILKHMVNRIAVPEADPFIDLTCLIAMYLATSFTISTAFRFYDYFVNYVMIPSLRKKISTYCIEHLLKLSHQFYQNNFAGSLGSKVSELVMAVPDLLQIIIDRFFSHGLALIVAVLTLWQINARFALLLLIWSVILLGVALLTSRGLTLLAAEWAFKGHRVTGRIVDTLSNMLTVRLFARGKNEDAWLTASIDEAKNAEKALELYYFKLWFLYGHSFFFVQCLNFYFLLQGRAEGWITVGDFALVLTLNINVMEFLWKMTQEFSKFSKLHGRIRQDLADLMVVPEIEDRGGAKELSLTQG